MTRGRLWDTNRCGDLIIKYKKNGVFLEVRTPKGAIHYRVKPRIPVEELKRKFAMFREQLFGVYVDDNKLIIRDHGGDKVVADLERLGDSGRSE